MQKKILIVDDDARNIFALSSFLKAKGYACLSAQGASEGLAILNNHDEIGILLVDMMMPEMDGYEMLSQIKSGNKGHIPIVAVTAQAMAGDREKCLQAGADDYISKPIDIDILMSVLSNHHVKSEHTITR